LSGNVFVNEFLCSANKEALIQQNRQAIDKEITWFSQVLDRRIKCYFNMDGCNEIPLPEPPDLETDRSLYGILIRHFAMSVSERLILILSLLPHLRHACLLAVTREEKVVLKDDIMRGVQNEFTKSGRLFREY